MNIKSVFHCLSYINKIDASSIHAPRPGKEVPQQSHTCYEVVFYDNGCSGVTEIDGVEYKFNSGDIAFIHKNVLHSEKHFSDGTLYFFGFDVIDDKAFYIPKVCRLYRKDQLLFRQPLQFLQQFPCLFFR